MRFRYRNATHYLVGILLALSPILHWTLPLVGITLFLAYQVNEDWHLRDKAFLDILECAIGFFFTIGVFLIVEVVK